MKRKIMRELCMKTGPVLQGIGIVTFLITASADLERSSLPAVFGLCAGSLLLVFLGVYLERLLPRYYRRCWRKQKRQGKICRIEKSIRKAA